MNKFGSNIKQKNSNYCICFAGCINLPGKYPGGIPDRIAGAKAIYKMPKAFSENKMGRKQIILLFSNPKTNITLIQRHFNEETDFMPGFAFKLGQCHSFKWM
jgi:hypothetical protein